MINYPGEDQSIFINYNDKSEPCSYFLDGLTDFYEPWCRPFYYTAVNTYPDITFIEPYFVPG